MLHSFTAWLVCISFVLAQSGDSNNRFISPPQSGQDQQYGDNVVWELGSTQKIEWTTELTNYSISLWQQDLTFDHSTIGPAFFTKSEDSPAVTEFAWSVQPFNFEIGASNVFFLGLNWAQTAGGFTSHYFNISQKAASSSSIALVITSSPTSTAASAISATLASTTSASPSSLPSSNNGLKVGLGAGLGVGIPVALAIGAFLGFRSMKKKRQYGGVSQELDQVTRYDRGLVKQLQVNETGHQEHELPGSPPPRNPAQGSPAELPGWDGIAREL